MADPTDDRSFTLTDGRTCTTSASTGSGPPCGLCGLRSTESCFWKPSFIANARSAPTVDDRSSAPFAPLLARTFVANVCPGSAPPPP